MQGGDFTVASRTLDDKHWVVAFLVDNGPVRYYLYDRDAKKARFLFTNRKELEGLPLQKMHPVLIRTRDGLDLVSYLTLPRNDPDGKGRPRKPVPMVLVVHGGPWDRDTWGFDPTHQFLANRGYAVLSVNYRGSVGFGKKFLNAGRREWGRKMHHDLIDAVDWAVAEKIAPADKVAIFGLSYGGYATLVGLSFTPEKFACGVDMVGPSNLVTLLNTIPPYWTSILQMLKDRIGDPSTEDGRKFLAERLPPHPRRADPPAAADRPGPTTRASSRTSRTRSSRRCRPRRSRSPTSCFPTRATASPARPITWRSMPWPRRSWPATWAAATRAFTPRLTTRPSPSSPGPGTCRG